MTDTECYCPVCERDEPLTRKVAFSEFSEETFSICDGCFENRPEDVVEVFESEEKATS